MSRASTDGCTEWSCPYHGEENRRKTLLMREREAVERVTRTENLGGLFD